jgi:hypothetical protein
MLFNGSVPLRKSESPQFDPFDVYPSLPKSEQRQLERLKDVVELGEVWKGGETLPSCRKILS